MIGIAPQHVPDATLARAFSGIGNALREKRVVPQVGVRVERHRRKENHDRLMQCIRGFNRNVERGIVERALGALHPVHHAAAGWIGRAGATDGDARVRAKADSGHSFVGKGSQFGVSSRGR